MAEMPDAKLLSKDDVNYRQHEKCNTCEYFYTPNICELINGNISPDAVCDKWEIKPKKEPMDGDSYMTEYRKANAE